MLDSESNKVSLDTLWWFNIAMEHNSSQDELPTKHGHFPWQTVRLQRAEGIPWLVMLLGGKSPISAQNFLQNIMAEHNGGAPPKYVCWFIHAWSIESIDIWYIYIYISTIIYIYTHHMTIYVYIYIYTIWPYVYLYIYTIKHRSQPTTGNWTNLVTELVHWVGPLRSTWNKATTVSVNAVLGVCASCLEH
jgi:hypothetical protein